MSGASPTRSGVRKPRANRSSVNRSRKGSMNSLCRCNNTVSRYTATSPRAGRPEERRSALVSVTNALMSTSEAMAKSVGDHDVVSQSLSVFNNDSNASSRVLRVFLGTATRTPRNAWSWGKEMECLCHSQKKTQTGTTYTVRNFPRRSRSSAPNRRAAFQASDAHPRC
jgi:hypothetical protein